jgi:hypothetical protein
MNNYIYAIMQPRKCVVTNSKTGFFDSNKELSNAGQIRFLVEIWDEVTRVLYGNRRPESEIRKRFGEKLHSFQQLLVILHIN